MEQDLFSNLPREIAIDIFLTLPFPTIMSCKCVCKSWRHLLSTREFVDYHCSKSLPGLILSEEAGKKETSRRCEILEFVDSGRRLPCKAVFDFRIPHTAGTLHSSANALLMFLNYENQNVLVCNPLTREYINLHAPSKSSPAFWCLKYGFGVSKVSGEYKVVRIYTNPSYKFEVYTLGTGSWRSVAVGGGDDDALPHDPGVFVDGKLYGFFDLKETRISCFDLETEVLSTVPCPSSDDYRRTLLRALGDRLSLCINYSNGVVIWVMHEVGQWRKEFVVSEAKMHDRYRCHTFSAIKVFGDGDLLLAREGVGHLFYYSRKCETIEPISVTFFRKRRFRKRRYHCRVGYIPSFLPLNTFAVENVCFF